MRSLLTLGQIGIVFYSSFSPRRTSVVYGFSGPAVINRKRPYSLTSRRSSEGPDQGGGRSDMGGDTYSSKLDEIEALGGDSFFLGDNQPVTDTPADGREVDEASTLDMLSQMALSSSGGVSSLIPGLVEPSTSNPRTKASDSPPPTFDELEALGGDPFFLSGPDVADSEPVKNVASDDEINKRQSPLDILAQASSSNQDIMTNLKKETKPSPDSVDHESLAMEVLAMGGDPFFLEDFSGDDEAEARDEVRDEVLALGGDPFFLETGEAVDTPSSVGEKRDLDGDLLEENDADSFVSPIDILSQLAQSSETFAAESTTNNPAEITAETRDEETNYEEIEALGGDPFFLESEEEVAVIPSHNGPVGTSSATNGQGPTPRATRRKEEIRSEKWEWDGTVDEDAHLGFD